MKASLVVVLLFCAAAAAFAQSETRPRVFLTPAEVEAARTGRVLTPEQKILRETLIARATEALDTPMRYTVPGHPDQVLPYFVPWPTVRDSEMLLIRRDAADTDAEAVAYAVTGDRRYAARAWSNVRVLLATYKAFGSYHPHRENNDLAAAHAFMALATTWDLCADTAPEDVKRLVLTEGVRRARFMYNTAVSDWKLNGLPVPFETPGVPDEKKPYNRNIFAMLTTNHCWVDVALLGNLALALEDEDVSGAGPGSGPKDWLRFAVHFFTYIAWILPPDGSWPESRVYGAPYAFEGSMPFFRALKRAKGIDLFALNPFFHNFAYGRLYAVWNHPGHGGIANFGEGWGQEWHSAAWIYAVAAAYRDPVLQWAANCWTRHKPATDETAWQYLAYDPTLPEQRPDSAGLPTAIILSDISHIFVRGGSDPWGENDRVLAFRGTIAGRNQYAQHAQGKLPYIQTWHMHQSRNAVELAVGGSPLIWRATDYPDSTGLYSVLTVNGTNQRQPDSALPGVTDFDATDRYVTFSSEIGAAYPQLGSYRRRVVCIEPGLYVIADRAAAPEAVRMDFRLYFGRITEVRFSFAENSTFYVAGGHKGALFRCTLLSPDNLTAELKDADGRNASKTLRYGPPDLVPEYAVMAVIALGGAEKRVQQVVSPGGDLLGAFIPVNDRPLAVVIAQPEMEVNYSVPAAEASTRHLVTGMSGTGTYAVKAHRSGESIAVAISPGTGFTTSAQGNLLFDVSPEGAVKPVSAVPQKSAQEIAAHLAAENN